MTRSHPRGEMSDVGQCSNRLQLYLILLLVNFRYELGKIMQDMFFLFIILRNV